LRQIDNYEQKYGLCDRSEFDGDFIVPPEVRNRVNNLKGSLRIHGGLLTISRSRTFLSLSNNAKSSIHNSTPDLSRSVPNTPGSNHKLSLTSSYDSVLEENEDEGVIIVKKGKEKKSSKSQRSSVQHIFEQASSRRKSEDFLDSRSTIEKPQKLTQTSGNAYRLIPRIKKTVEYDDSVNKKKSVEIRDKSDFVASTSKPSTSIDSDTTFNHNSSWGHVRSSNSFACDLNVANLSMYTIPRVTLTHLRSQSSESKSFQKSHVENEISHTVLMKHNIKDSSA
jgi:hypothetical protein